MRVGVPRWPAYHAALRPILPGWQRVSGTMTWMMARVRAGTAGGTAAFWLGVYLALITGPLAV
jgi:hypothetical protein